MAIEVLPTDQCFDLSPDAGDPDCKCSRCGEQILAEECPIRCLTENEKGEVDENSKEYRYCEKCLNGMGVMMAETMYSIPEELYGPNWME